ncbi:MAG: hypothetical protein J0M35_17820 [Candidatus Obscuribacter phosphatis]|uniref:Uncharacterized protein n=1 Tax=Candidatus Obscuribacter phosphatis TaxID=1906157 RepID=A0A8J7PIZ2_9BACT|nr:hypothetical protein [Candidatus Obscuribacter phosphatis]
MSVSILRGFVAMSLGLSLMGATSSAAALASTANTVEVPSQILKSGINLSTTTLCPNSQQLADQLNLTPLLTRIQELRALTAQQRGQNTLEALSNRVSLQETLDQARAIIFQTAMEADFVSAEVQAEQNVYAEVLASYQASRDKMVAGVNAVSFITNGILWAVSCGLAIPTYKYPGYSVQSGATGIIAGMVPSLASMYALKAYSGKKRTSEKEPNMLAKLFDYPTNSEIEYPNSVWKFLTSVPAEGGGKTRKEELVERWISDKNIPSFTDSKAKKQLDILTASEARRKGLSIDSLNTRIVMLEQLDGEVGKMKRLLLELAMAVNGIKQI